MVCDIIWWFPRCMSHPHPGSFPKFFFIWKLALLTNSHLDVYNKSFLFINDTPQVCKGFHIFQSFVIWCDLVGVYCALVQHRAFLLVNVEKYFSGGHHHIDSLLLHLLLSGHLWNSKRLAIPRLSIVFRASPKISTS